MDKNLNIERAYQRIKKNQEEHKNNTRTLIDRDCEDACFEGDII